MEPEATKKNEEEKEDSDPVTKTDAFGRVVLLLSVSPQTSDQGGTQEGEEEDEFDCEAAEQRMKPFTTPSGELQGLPVPSTHPPVGFVQQSPGTSFLSGAPVVLSPQDIEFQRRQATFDALTQQVHDDYILSRQAFDDQEEAFNAQMREIQAKSDNLLVQQTHSQQMWMRHQLQPHQPIPNQPQHLQPSFQSSSIWTKGAGASAFSQAGGAGGGGGGDDSNPSEHGSHHSNGFPHHGGGSNPDGTSPPSGGGPLVVVPLLVDMEPLGMGPLDFLAMVMVAVVPVVAVVVEEAMDQLTLTTVVASFSRLMIRRRSTARTPR